ncbi:MAG: cyclopropane-fatty-acyl-phospholipid synthase, partial [Deltaproteobacteria bacterium]
MAEAISERSVNGPRRRLAELLKLADVEVYGSRPWDMRVNDERLFRRVLAQGALGLGEAYMDGWWDSGQLDDLFARVLRARLQEKIVLTFSDATEIAKSLILNRQTRSRAAESVRRHYDIGNDLYQRMLDRRML